MSDLMQKLAISKQIMDKHNNTPRNHTGSNLQINENINATYNIPNDIIQENTQKPQIGQGIQMNQPSSADAIRNSKLPDEIKKLMIENPITQPQMGSAVLSDDVIEGAMRLMGSKKQPITETKNLNTTPNVNSDLKQMIRDVVRDTVKDVVREELQNAGLLSESTQNTNETLSLRVGKHIFEGKVLKIKKVKQ